MSEIVQSSIQPKGGRILGSETLFFIMFTSLCGISFEFLLIFQWIIVDAITPFLMAPLFLMVGGVFVLSIIVSLLYFVIRVWKIAWHAVIPLFINVCFLLIFLFVPFTAIFTNLQFYVNLHGYNQVVKEVESGQIVVQQGEEKMVTLPSQYRYLSSGGGDVIVYQDEKVTRVFFYTFRGILDNYSGYMYTSDDLPPQGEWVESFRKKPNWFWCASN